MTQRGFIQLSLLGWGAVAAGVVILGLTVVLKVQTARLEASQSAFSAFKAQVEQEGKAAEKQRLQDILDRKAISDKKEAEDAKRYAALGVKYRAAVAAARLPNSPGSGETQPLSSAAAVISCPDRQPDLAGRLAELETGVLEILERGDKAIARTITCKSWLDEQIAK